MASRAPVRTRAGVRAGTSSSTDSLPLAMRRIRAELDKSADRVKRQNRCDQAAAVRAQAQLPVGSTPAARCSGRAGGGPDGGRGDRRGHVPGDSGGDRRRRESVPDGKALRQLAWRRGPRQHESNGKTNRGRGPRKGKNRVAIALRMAAQAVGRTQSPLGLFYRRIRGRIGGQGAVTATAHKLAVPGVPDAEVRGRST